MIHYRQATKEDIQALIDIASRVIQNNYAPFLGADITSEFVESGMADQEIYDGIHTCALPGMMDRKKHQKAE